MNKNSDKIYFERELLYIYPIYTFFPLQIRRFFNSARPEKFILKINFYRGCAMIGRPEVYV